MKQIGLVLGILVVLGGVLYYVLNLSAPAAPESTLGTTGQLNSNGTPNTKFDFARALLNINTIKLDLEFFNNDAAWASLEDITQPLRTPDKGRRNPFAPLDVEAPPAQAAE